MMVSFFIGIRLRKYREKRKHPVEDQSIGPLEGSLLGLLALLLSFTFSMSSSRHDKRLNIVIEEANNIGTAILRADLYPDSIRAAFRKDFKEYVHVRIAFFEAGANIDVIKSTLKQGNAIQKRLWERAAYYGRDRENLHRTSQMIPALNAMIDIVTTRNALSMAKVPELILYLLFLLCFISSLMMGYTVGKKPDWIIMLGFAITIVMTIYLILDLDRPRRGIITMKNVNMEIVNLRDVFEINE
jgi:ABC-type multidrug transport system fused ATPase/permease subunit